MSKSTPDSRQCDRNNLNSGLWYSGQFCLTLAVNYKQMYFCQATGYSLCIKYTHRNSTYKVPETMMLLVSIICQVLYLNSRSSANYLMISVLFQIGLTPVSYTHLDVYKRQRFILSLMRLVIKIKIKLFCRRTACPNATVS